MTARHRKIYQRHFGPIPKDEDGRSFDIHHIDGDRSNNDPSNLVALSMHDHFLVHFQQGDYNACSYIMARMKRSLDIEFEIVKLKCAELSRQRMMGEKNPSSKASGPEHWTRGTKFAKTKYGEIVRVAQEDSRFLSGELVLYSPNKSKVTVRYPGATTSFQVDKTDPRYLNGEVIAAQIRKITCPHCQKTGGHAAMKRWHFKNCRHRNENLANL